MSKPPFMRYLLGNHSPKPDKKLKTLINEDVPPLPPAPPLPPTYSLPLISLNNRNRVYSADLSQITWSVF